MPAQPIDVKGTTEEAYYLLGSAATPSTTASEASNRLMISKSPHHALQVINAGGATVLIEVSLDNVNWVPLIPAAATAAVLQTFTGAYRWVRASRGATVTPVTVIWTTLAYNN
jgi:hypothetical protein